MKDIKKNIIFYSMSVLALWMIIIFIVLLRDKGADFFLIGIYIIIYKLYKKDFCKYEENIHKKTKKELSIYIIATYVFLIVSTVLFIIGIIDTISMRIFGAGLGFYGWTAGKYVVSLVDANKQDASV